LNPNLDNLSQKKLILRQENLH